MVTFRLRGWHAEWSGSLEPARQISTPLGRKWFSNKEDCLRNQTWDHYSNEKWKVKAEPILPKMFFCYRENTPYEPQNMKMYNTKMYINTAVENAH